MIKKLEILVSTIPMHSHVHEDQAVVHTNLSIQDVANKLNEVIDFINSKESDARQ